MRIFVIIVIMVCAAWDCFADTVKLKNGTVITAEIIERKGDEIKINRQGAEITYWLDEVESINGEHINGDTLVPSEKNLIKSRGNQEDASREDVLKYFVKIAQIAAWGIDVNEPAMSELQNQKIKNPDLADSVFPANLEIVRKMLSLYQSLEIPDDNDIVRYHAKIIKSSELAAAGMEAALKEDVRSLQDIDGKLGPLEEEVNNMLDLMLKKYDISDYEISEMISSGSQDFKWMEPILQSQPRTGAQIVPIKSESVE